MLYNTVEHRMHQSKEPGRPREQKAVVSVPCPLQPTGLCKGRAIKDLTRITLSFYCTPKCVTSAEHDLCLGYLRQKYYPLVHGDYLRVKCSSLGEMHGADFLARPLWGQRSSAPFIYKCSGVQVFTQI